MAGAEGSYSLSRRLVKPESRRRAQRAYAVAAAGQNLVWIGLVSNVPDNSVARVSNT